VSPHDVPTEAPLAPGSVLPEGHRVEEVLAVGRIGTAYVVRNAEGERRAAYVLHADRVDALREWFVKSAWLRESLDHAHLPRTFAVGTTDDGRPVEITELLEGETLREALANRSAPIPLGVVARVVRELAAALDHLHGRVTPVVHRALTPECVLLTAPDGKVKLLGIGDADRPEADAVRPAYLSPEALAELSVTPRADVFVLASIAYEMLTGTPAFPGTRDEVIGTHRAGQRPRVSVLRTEIPSAVDDVLHTCWALAADQRPSCAMEFALAFSTALGVDDTSEHPIVHDTVSGTASLQVMRRRSALLGPTQEVPAPDLGSPRSFLGAVEQTEVSVAVPEQSPTSRASTALRSTHATLRDEGARKLVLAPPHPSGTAAAPRAPVMAQPRVASPAPAEASGGSSPSDRVVSPFTDDLRATLQPQSLALGDALAATASAEASSSTVSEPRPSASEATRSQSATVAAAPPHASGERPSASEATSLQSLVSGPSSAPASSPNPLPAPLKSLQHDGPSADAAVHPPYAHASPAPLPFAPLPGTAPPRVPSQGFSPLPSPASSQPVVLPSQETSHARSSGADASEVATHLASHRRHAPEGLAFPDEPTGTVPVSPSPSGTSPWRSPLVVASIFLAHAMLIVGIAHAIALVANREPVVRVVQGPAPVCAPCAPCPVCSPSVPSPPAPPHASSATPAPAARAVSPAPLPRAAPPPTRQLAPF